MKVFVTGATGFVGRNFLEWLLRNQPHVSVTCLVRDVHKAQAQWPTLPHNVQWLAGDLLEPDSYRAALSGVNAVFHAAALVSLKNGPEFYRMNTEATRNLVAALGEGKDLQRLVFVSSISAVDRPMHEPAVDLLDEDFAPHPNTDYGKSKLLAEEVVSYSGLPYTILRPAYIYGPHPRLNSSMDRLIRDISAQTPYTRFPFPGQASGIHAQDLAAMMWLAARHPQAENEAFFVSNPQPIPIVEAFAHIASALNVPYRPLERAPEHIRRAQHRWYHRQPDHLVLRILFENFFACNPAKWYRATGFQPTFDYSAGLNDTVRWYQAHGLI